MIILTSVIRLVGTTVHAQLILRQMCFISQTFDDVSIDSIHSDHPSPHRKYKGEIRGLKAGSDLYLHG